jgi:outer membrane lipoprotein-sorting protein
MKKSIFVLVSLLLSATWGFTQTANEIIDQADSMFRLEQVYSRSSLEVIRNGRAQATQTMEMYELESDDGTTRALTVFSAPPRVAGTAYLTIGNDLWVRFASTGRVRKMSSSAKSNSAAGSDFSYSDMGDGSQSFTDQYIPRLLGPEVLTNKNAWKLELTPKAGEDTSYEKLIVWVSQNDFLYLQIEYYQDNSPIKIMTLSDFQEVSGVQYPFTIEMRSLVNDSRSIITTEYMEENSSRVQERFFSTSYLRNIR